MKTQPKGPAIKLGERGHRIIRKNFRKLVHQEKIVLVEKDPEALHQMRVRMRCLRTAVQVFGAALVLPKKVSHASMGKISSSLGKARDLDVLRERMIHYQPFLSKAERPLFSRAQKHLLQSRNKSFQQVKKTLHSDRYCHMKHSLQAWIDRPVYTLMGGLPLQPILPDLLAPLISRLFIHPGWLVGTTLQDGVVTLIPVENYNEWDEHRELPGTVLHDLRKQIKALRYPLEFFSGFGDASCLQRIRELKKMQDILGQLHDQLVLCQFLESILQEEVETLLPTLNQVMQRERAECWQHWQPLQQNYLSPDFRQSLRSIFIHHMKPAWRLHPA